MVDRGAIRGARTRCICTIHRPGQEREDNVWGMARLFAAVSAGGHIAEYLPVLGEGVAGGHRRAGHHSRGIGEHHQLRYLLAGAMAGAVSRTATAPLDRLKVMLAVQTHTTTATGIMHGLKHIYKHNGVAGFFRGNGLNVLKISPESAIKFYCYEVLKKVVIGDGKHGEIGTSGRLVAGGAAGALLVLVWP